MSAVCLYNSAAKRQPEPETPPSIGAGAGLREHLAIKDLREHIGREARTVVFYGDPDCFALTGDPDPYAGGAIGMVDGIF